MLEWAESPVLLGLAMMLVCVAAGTELVEISAQRFATCFGVFVAAMLAKDCRAFVRFYTWFASSKHHSRAGQRGLGHPACAPYGVELLRPLLAPRGLGVAAFRGAVLALAASLALAGLTGARAAWLAASVLYFPVFGALFLESRVGGHATMLLPQITLALALTSQAPAGLELAVQLLQAQVGVTYTTSALCKLASAGARGKLWFDGATLQTYLLQGRVYRASPSPHVLALQEFIVRRAWLCVLLGIVAFGFELMGGFVCLLPLRARCAWTAVALAFHVGTWLLQGFDFIAYWAVALGVLVVPTQPLAHTLAAALGGAGLPDLLALGLGAAHFAAAVGVALSFGEFFDPAQRTRLPFSCAPMFCQTQNLFAPGPQPWVMLSIDPRHSGYVEGFGELAGTFFAASARELGELPYWFYGVTVAPEAASPLHADANFAVPPELQAAAQRLARALHNRTPGDAWRPRAVDELMAALAHMRAVFDAAWARLPPRAHNASALV